MKRHCTSVKQRAVGKERCLLDRPGARARVFRVPRVCPGYRGRPRVPCVPCVSRLPPVSFYSTINDKFGKSDEMYGNLCGFRRAALRL